MKKYYLITYSGWHIRERRWNHWTDVISISPLEFILEVNKDEDDNYLNFVITYSMEISKEGYDKF